MIAELAPNTLSAQELARTFAAHDPSATPDQVALRAISSLGDMAARLIAIELLAREVAQIRRGEVRVIERAATSVAVVRATTRAEARRERVEALTSVVIGVRLDLSRRFLASTFVVNGERVTWGQATVAQHATRIDRLATQAAGLQDTVARHQEAIRLIEERHARSLADLV